VHDCSCCVFVCVTCFSSYTPHQHLSTSTCVGLSLSVCDLVFVVCVFDLFLFEHIIVPCSQVHERDTQTDLLLPLCTPLQHVFTPTGSLFTGARCRVLCCCCLVLVVSCVVLFLLCVCVCDLFLSLQVHERDTQTDLLLLLLRELLPSRPELRVICMSATVQVRKLAL